MQNANIELIEQARDCLRKSQHETCFDILNMFFAFSEVSPESPINQLYNQLFIIETRYHHLIQEQRKGTITYEQYDLTFNKISDALYAFFDSVIDEAERLVDTKTVQEGTPQNNRMNIVLVINGNFDDFSEEKAINIVNKIRNDLGLKKVQFRYLNIEEGSILIHVKIERNYELLIKLKSLIELDVVDNLVSIETNDILMDRFCVAMENLKLGSLLQDYLIKGGFDDKLLSRGIRQTLARYKTYKELQAKKRKLNAIKIRLSNETVNSGYWEIDIVTNEMTWSDQVCKIFGFVKPRLSIPSVTDYMNYIHPDDRDLVQNTFEEAIKDLELHKIEYRVIGGTSQVQYVANQFQISYDDASPRTLLFGVLHDITDRKRLEELLIQDKILKGASKMKEDILENMSCHIRNPLSSIINLSYILNDSNLDTEQKESIKALQQSVGDLSLAINNMLNFSLLILDKITVDEEQFAIKNTIESLVKMSQIKANRKSITFKVYTDENLPKYLIGDERKINQVLYNILDNAIKYTENGGRIEFAIEVQKIEMGKATITFRIEDNDVGMTKEKIEEILDSHRLLNMNKEEKKKNLELAIATRLTEIMGGELKVASEKRKGTTFTVDIKFSIINVVAQKIVDTPTRPIKVLFVDDHFLNQIVTKRMLIMWSDFVSIDIADNGKIGFEKFEANDYDIILMDLQMPVMNGFEASARIRTINPDIPIIGLLTNTSKAEVEKCFATGINDYLVKPYTPEDLKSKIMNLVYE